MPRLPLVPVRLCSVGWPVGAGHDVEGAAMTWKSRRRWPVGAGHDTEPAMTWGAAMTWKSGRRWPVGAGHDVEVEKKMAGRGRP